VGGIHLAATAKWNRNTVHVMTLAIDHDVVPVARRRSRPRADEYFLQGWMDYAARHRARRCHILAAEAHQLAQEADEQFKSLYLDLTRELVLLIEEIEADAA
jgi:hypothetical protein